MTTEGFINQSERNEIGFQITCQIGALLRTLSRERDQDSSHFEDLLGATLPRLLQLNDAATAIFSDENAFADDSVKACVYGEAHNV
ncbi:MAG: hypothetical protein EKK47_10355 [Burkholderiales bacterium]|nr:MAG: hypothetical protein EKK47_10355 [Burkholderiales bacterium]